MSDSLVFTCAFAAVVIIGLSLKFWLASRQIRYVAKHHDEVPKAFSQTITLASHQKAAEYTVAKMRFGFVEVTWGTAILLCWTLFGGLDLLNKALLGMFTDEITRQLALVSLFAIFSGFLDLPLELWHTFGLEQRFGFNKMTWRLWLADASKRMLLGALIGLPIATFIIWIMEASEHFWWLWAWGAWMAFNLLLMMVYPIIIAPLFNKFQPLNDSVLMNRVAALMERCGYATKGLFVMDGSRRSAHANAYFTGFGISKRVVFYDTLLKQLNANEVEAVLAHELGHFKNNHIAKRILVLFAFSFVGFALLGWLIGKSWFYTGLGVQPNLESSNNALALLLFMLASPVFGFFLNPLTSRFSRKHEFEADSYAAKQTNGADLSAALLKLHRDNAATLTPDPVFASFYYSHPPASERLARLDSLT